MNKHKKFPTIIGLIILILGAAVGVYLVTSTTLLRPQASPNQTPKDIRVSNVTDNSFTVSWTTDASTFGLVEWGETPALGKTQTDGSDLKQNHYITVNNLIPQTNYFYKINSAGTTFDNAGIPWSITTLPASSNQSSSEVISGTVVDNNNVSIPNVIVYINADGINTLSAKTAESGGFLIPLGSTKLSSEDLLQVFAQGGMQGTSSAQIFYKSANPIPQLVLGQTHDFRNLEEVDQIGVPKSAIDVPEEIVAPASKIVLSGATPSPSTPTSVETVTLENIFEGQTLTNSTPEFLGKAPGGQVITITVQSDPITQELEVPEDGNWSWTVPEGLEPGEHTVTVEWTDDSGVLQQLTRSFEVSAQELTSPTPVATLTPTPEEATNSTGLTLTIILSIIGIGLIITGLFWNIKISKKIT